MDDLRALTLLAAAHDAGSRQGAHPIRAGWGRPGEGGTSLPRVAGARPLVGVHGRNGMVRVHGRNALGGYPKAARLGLVHGAQRLAGGSNGGRRTPLQDEAEPGGGATAAHLAVRRSDRSLPVLFGNLCGWLCFRKSIMRQILTYCKQFLTHGCLMNSYHLKLC
jgi:hypothetical protein